MKYTIQILLLYYLLNSVKAVLPAGEKAALQTFYNALNGGNWYYVAWNFSTDPCATPVW